MEVQIRDEMIRLGQLLKLANVVEDGATARQVIENGEVKVNGQVETRRGTQIRPGMVASFAGQRMTPVNTGSSR
ncbi:RNA-binding S4 domain-containing protein [Ornithinimicrobium sp. Arc0846-15]|nr:RNA-binding S4 domain-containing protein [Ornithinimicrobium laminariae]